MFSFVEGFISYFRVQLVILFAMPGAVDQKKKTCL